MDLYVFYFLYVFGQVRSRDLIIMIFDNNSLIKVKEKMSPLTKFEL